jgi:hypothetical protein
MILNVQQRNASAAIHSLLEGQPPNGTNPSECGPWAETVTSLYEAYAVGGVTAVRNVFNALVKHTPELIRLVSSEPVTKTQWSVAELYDEPFPALKFIVPGIVPSGITSLAGRPKVGKSWLALQIAQAVGTGGHTLGQAVAAGKVLYLALEDTARRLQDRCLKQHIPREAQTTFVTAWQPFDQGGLADLVVALSTQEYTFVIIDTLSRAFGRADQMDNGAMNDLMGQLHQIVQTYEKALLLIDHHRKNKSLDSDPIDDILGSTAKSAVVDAALGLYKERGKPNATLKVTGRDLEEREIALQWDAALFSWQCLGDAQEVAKGTVQQQILETLAALGGQATMTELAEALGKPTSNVSRELQELVTKGKVKRGERNGRQVAYLLIEG